MAGSSWVWMLLPVASFLCGHCLLYERAFEPHITSQHIYSRSCARSQEQTRLDPDDDRCSLHRWRPFSCPCRIILTTWAFLCIHWSLLKSIHSLPWVIFSPAFWTLHYCFLKICSLFLKSGTVLFMSCASEEETFPAHSSWSHLICLVI